MSSNIKRFGYKSEQGSSRAVRVESLAEIFTTQVFPTTGTGEVVAAGDSKVQIEWVLNRLEEMLGETAWRDRLVRLHVCARSQTVVDTFKEILRNRYGEQTAPAVTYVIGKLPLPEYEVAVDAVAVSDESLPFPSFRPEGSGTERVAEVLPAGPRVFISGQAEPGDFETGVRGTMKSLFQTLEFLGLKPSDIVQLKGFVQPIERAVEARELMIESFAPNPAPPIVLVEWSSSLPIEIELIASAKDAETHTGEKRATLEYLTPPGMTTSPVYSKLTFVGNLPTIYISGIYGQPGAEAADQVHSIFRSLDQILREAGSDLEHLVKATYYVSNEETSSELNEIRPKYYDPSRPPAASKAMVEAVGQEGCDIAIDMIAVPATEGP